MDFVELQQKEVLLGMNFTYRDHFGTILFALFIFLSNITKSL